MDEFNVVLSVILIISIIITIYFGYTLKKIKDQLVQSITNELRWSVGVYQTTFSDLDNLAKMAMQQGKAKKEANELAVMIGALSLLEQIPEGPESIETMINYLSRAERNIEKCKELEQIIMSQFKVEQNEK